MAVFFVVAAVGLFFILVYNPLDPEARALRRQEKLLKEMEEKYKNDAYGGATPEETLQLFIDALKKGDTDLAAKYFIIDKQEEWREDLSKIKERNLLGEMVRDLERTELTLKDDTAFFSLIGEDNVVESELVMHKSEASGKWKITEL